MKRLSVVIFAISLALHGFSQNEDYKSTICVNAGFSLVGSLLNASNTLNSAATEDPKSTSIPALQVTYDYGVANWFSMGAAFSYQMMKSDVTGYDQSTTYKYTDKINRMNVAVRMLFHYANANKVDLYSGVRLGLTNWSFSTDNNDDTYNVGDYWDLKNNFAPQLVLFGIRGYFTDHLGLNSELCVGAPHFFSVGLSYRL
jgi:hypothetical protein